VVRSVLVRGPLFAGPGGPVVLVVPVVQVVLAVAVCRLVRSWWSATRWWSVVRSRADRIMPVCGAVLVQVGGGELVAG
jgi:hypothetical protein